MADEQLGLFGADPEPSKKGAKKKSASKKKAKLDPDREPTEAEQRPFSLTARDAQEVHRSSFVEYLGIMRASKQIVCRRCLDTLGAVRSLDGVKFLHYLWTERASGKVTCSECVECGEIVEFERI